MRQRPIKIASPEQFRKAWNNSPDCVGKGKAAGIDGQRPTSFAGDLTRNIEVLSGRVVQGAFEFNRLRFHPLPKANGKYRILCIPTVQDRLVQRVMLQYLLENDKLKVRNQASYGFISDEDKTVQKAIATASRLREKNGYAVKTGIVSFFNRIDRNILLEKFPQRIRGSSIFPLIQGAISCEIARPKNGGDRTILNDSDIEPGKGLWQGMPLSPVFSNLFLRNFDKTLISKEVQFVRYADDLVVFCNTGDDAKRLFETVENELEKIRLEIPDLNVDDTKSKIYRPSDPVEFLGIELRLTNGRVKQYVPSSIFERIANRVTDFQDWQQHARNGSDVFRLMGKMESLERSYLQTYRRTENFDDFKSYLHQRVHEAKMLVWNDLIGPGVVKSLSSDRKKFMRIGHLRSA